jgi:hypothetical protein
MIVNAIVWTHPHTGTGYHAGFDPSVWNATVDDTAYVLFLRGARRGYHQEWVLRANGKDIGTFDNHTAAMLSI